MAILLIINLGIISFNAWVAMHTKDQLWFIFSLLSIGLLIIAVIIYIKGLII